MMRKLVDLSQIRSNLIPILDDASKPRNYLHLVEKVDIIYADVASPSQTDIFMDNMRLFIKEGGQGFLMIKARSIDVTRDRMRFIRKKNQG